MKKTLLVGYGNLDRQDDGVAWHVLLKLLKKFDQTIPNHPDDGILDLESNPSFMFLLQLTPELSEVVANYEKVCFIDAHTGNVPHDFQMTEVFPIFQNSPFTHHMTPQTCLSLSNTLYGGNPKSVLVSIRGYEFDFSQNLSAKTQSLVNNAFDIIWEWLTN